MKNNKISLSQFAFLSFTTTLSGLLFVDISVSFIQILYILLSILANMTVLFFYKGKSNVILNFTVNLYLFIVCVFVLNKFIIFMNSQVKSGPYYAILLITVATVYFCSNKGFEAISRASIIITFFVALFLIYICIGSFKDIANFKLKLVADASKIPALLCLFPSAIYISNYSNIINKNKSVICIYSTFSFVILSYMTLYATSFVAEFPLYSLTQQIKLSVFKGGEFLLMTIITIATILLLSTSLNSIKFKIDNNHKILLNLCVISVISIISLYINSIGAIFSSEIILFVATIIILLFAFLFNKKIQRNL